jgi:heme A synthase
MKSAWLHVYAWLVAAGALVAVLSGAFAMNREVPASAEWKVLSISGHWALSAGVGLLMFSLAVWSLFADKSLGVRRLGWMLLVGTAAEGGFGLVFGPTSFAGMAHAILGPLMLAAVVAIAMMTSSRWQSEPQFVQDRGWPSLRGLGRNSVVLVVIQVILGAAFRYEMLGVMWHILMAMVVVIFLLALVVLITMLPAHPTLKPLAIMLSVILFVQVFLGLAVVSMGSGKSANLAIVGLGASHVAMGAVTLAAAGALYLEIRRSVHGA